jgi:hypothetical protein
MPFGLEVDWKAVKALRPWARQFTGGSRFKDAQRRT